MLENIAAHPKKIFLIDGFGALLSAFLLAVVLVRLENIFGIPARTLYFLATLPVLFAMYDCYAFRQDDSKLGQFLKVIAIMNLLYCLVSIGFAFYHIATITSLGWAYIIIEILIVILLATFEYKVAKKLISKNHAE